MVDFNELAADIGRWGKELGFQETGISDTELTAEENYLQQWLGKGYHGEMDYMARHGATRARPLLRPMVVSRTISHSRTRRNIRPPLRR